MLSASEVHDHRDDGNPRRTARSTKSAFLSGTAFKILMATIALSIVTTSIVVPVVLVKRSKNRSSASTAEATLSTTRTNTATTATTTATLSTTATSTTAPNLLLNPGAETGSIAGWTQMGPSEVMIDSGDELNKDYLPHNGSSYCFAGGVGSNGGTSGLKQTIQLLSGVQDFTEQELDSEDLVAELIFYYQTWNHYSVFYDKIAVVVTFKSASQSTLKTVETGEYDCEISPGWCLYQDRIPLPRGTRSIDYTMTFIRRVLFGKNIDSYIDDNSLKIIY